MFDLKSLFRLNLRRNRNEKEDREHLDAKLAPALVQRRGDGGQWFHNLQFRFVFGTHARNP